MGIPRSGTTLLGMILNAHSALSVAPETHYFTTYWRACRGDNCLSNPSKYQRYIELLLGSPELADMQLSFNAFQHLRESLLELDPPNHAAILSTILETYAQKSGTDRIVEKTPGHLPFLPLLNSYFPDSRFLILTRDPRDVALSWQKMPGDRGNSFNVGLRWRWYEELSRRYFKNGHQVLRVRFEDLLDDPSNTMAEVCRFVDLSFEHDMVGNRSISDPFFDVSREPWKKKSLEPIDSSNQGKWRTQLSTADCHAIELVIGSQMKEKGYERSEHRLYLVNIIKVLWIITSGLSYEFKRLILRPTGRLRWLFYAGEKPS